MRRGAGGRRPGVRVYAPGTARKRYRNFIELVRMVDELEARTIALGSNRVDSVLDSPAAVQGDISLDDA